MIRIRRRAFRRRNIVLGSFLVSLVAALVLSLTTDKNGVLNFVWRQTRGTWAEPYVVGWALTESRDPLDRDLASGRFKAGDSFDALVARHPPTRIVCHGRYTTANYGGGFGGTGVTARDGKLVMAGSYSCTYSHTFFNTLSAAEEAAVNASYIAARNREREEREAAFLAAAGFGTTFDPWNLPRAEDPKD